ncbi:extracellular solute-binding protein [Gryllotalpicola protaetiae]|uniref:Extracellular solute-binding protein n=1 Tax=Gryllotalpicola protaetiae TaxID=2419771 RepID=A0A387BZL3_9MICO|nr:extracellular solute-binding protein [Gryllotalpicola protaetiae]AYG03781.1 extracellular solute-binding protein [Gryllotalpicola protaetiae]
MSTPMRRRTRAIVTATAVLSALVLSACTAPGAAQSQDKSDSKIVKPIKPTKPVDLDILDAAGDLLGTKQVFESFKKAHPDWVGNISYETAGAPDVTGKLKAQSLGGNVTITMVLGGTGVVGPAVAQNLLVKQYPDYQSDLPDLSKVFDKPRQELQDLSMGYGVMNRWGPSGPLLEYNPDKVSDPPTTPQELLAWAKAHPKQFSYAQPPNSGSGWIFLQGLPYLLGDKDPSDPVNGWSKTWAYLAELNKYTAPYPASSTIIGQQFGSGQITLMPQIVGIDIVTRQNGTVPPNSAVTTFKPQVWLGDGHYWMIPKGVSPQVLYVDLALEKYMMTDKEQAATMSAENGELTTANKNVTISDAPAAAQAGIQKWGRPDFYPKAFTQGKTVATLSAAELAKAFDIWNEKIGGAAQ